jgi:hypothetical protein
MNWKLIFWEDEDEKVGGKEEEKRRGRAGRAVLFIAHRLLDVFLFWNLSALCECSLHSHLRGKLVSGVLI